MSIAVGVKEFPLFHRKCGSNVSCMRLHFDETLPRSYHLFIWLSAHKVRKDNQFTTKFQNGTVCYARAMG